MPIQRVALLAVLLAAALAAQAAERTVQIYRPHSRTAAELLAPAQAVLGDEGTATVDAGTNTLVLVGEPPAIAAALVVLEELDRSLATVVLHYESQRLEELTARGIQIAWSISAGSFRVGNVRAPPGTDLVALRPFDDRREGRSRLRGMLRVQDGQVGRIESGATVPIVQRVSPWQSQVALVNASSGFEARPQVLSNGQVRVEIQSFEGALEPGGVIRHSGAATEITIEPGETVAIGGLEQEREQRSRGLGGVAEEKRYEDQVLLLRVEVETRSPTP